jgi:hypothetical protein
MAKDPTKMNWGLYIFKPKSQKKKEDAQAIFIYDDGQTNIYPLPNSPIEARLNKYKDELRSGEIKHNAWEQFNYFIRMTYSPAGDLFELSDEKRDEIAEILKGWDSGQ